MLRGKCKCGNTLKNVKPLPRYPKENNKISEHEHISKICCRTKSRLVCGDSGRLPGRPFCGRDWQYREIPLTS